VAAIEEFDPITIVSLRYCGDASYSYYTASQQGHLYSTRSCKLESQSSGATCSWHKNWVRLLLPVSPSPARNKIRCFVRSLQSAL